MLNRKKLMALGAIAATACVGGGSVAIAASSSPAPAPSVSQSFTALSGPSTAIDAKEAGAKQALSTLPDGAVEKTIDWSRAVGVAVENSTATAYLAPAGDSVCTVVVRADGAVGAGCDTVEQLRKSDGGGGLLVVGGGSDVIAVAPIADGGSAPTVSTGTSKSQLAVRSNVAAAQLATTGTLQVNGTSANLAQYKQLPRSVAPTK